ncbi:MAG: GNAT family N-acetyltransferase [Flavobacterium sp.]
MELFKVRFFKPEDTEAWNHLVAHASQPSFLFFRDFMTYHQHLFTDASVVVVNSLGKLVALLPAHVKENNLYSHFGLTFGGMVVAEKCTSLQWMKYFYLVLEFLHQQGFEKIFWKEIPSFYGTSPRDEFSYLAFITKAKLQERHLCQVVDLQSEIQLTTDRKAGVKRGIQNQLYVQLSNQWEYFYHQLLLPNLQEKHQQKPVHSLEEILMLQQKFPDNIQLYGVFQEQQMVAGTILFISSHVVHSQYIASNKAKNLLGSLDFLHHELLTKFFSHKKCFDFGISHEQKGTKINEGLFYWKQGFGAKPTRQDIYEIELKNYPLIQEVWI